MRGIYVHIPFCVRKCSYCDFYSVAGDRAAAEEFRGLLVREMDMFRKNFPAVADAPADTVFFGGGTPTVLGAEGLCGLLSALRERFSVAQDAEITTEANPGTVAADDLRALREGGFNRLSIGVQSFARRTLQTLGRIHGAEAAQPVAPCEGTKLHAAPPLDSGGRLRYVYRVLNSHSFIARGPHRRREVEIHVSEDPPGGRSRVGGDGIRDRRAPRQRRDPVPHARHRSSTTRRGR